MDPQMLVAVAALAVSLVGAVAAARFSSRSVGLAEMQDVRAQLIECRTAREALRGEIADLKVENLKLYKRMFDLEDKICHDRNCTHRVGGHGPTTPA